MTLVEKIAEIIKRAIRNRDRYETPTEYWAKEIHQLYLSDPSIIEVDTKAELPKIAYWDEDKQETYYGDLPTWCTDAFIKAGWVKPKE